VKFIVNHWIENPTSTADKLKALQIDTEVVEISGNKFKDEIHIDIDEKTIVTLSDHFDVMIIKRKGIKYILLDEKGKRFSQR